MTHTRWIYPIDLSGEDEARQAIERQPYFILKCSKIVGASYLKVISKKDIPDITCDGYLYYIEEEKKYIVLHKHCSFLLGIFNLEMKRIFQQDYDLIKEKSKDLNTKNDEFKKANSCLCYQNIVTSHLSPESEEYTKSLDLLNYFKEKVSDLKKVTNDLEKEIEKMISEYVNNEIKQLVRKSNEINIQGIIKLYLDFLIRK